MTSSLPSEFQSFIHLSRYSRWIESENRRETWPETVKRYFDFFENHLKQNFNYDITDIRYDLEQSVLNLEVMPSMRALMTAGPALERDNVAGYNCCFVACNKLRVFDEILYILSCLHPDTKIITQNGEKTIAEINPNVDLLLTFNETTGELVFEQPLEVIETRTGSEEDILEFTFDDGSTIQCTTDHKILTTNRGWVEAKDLSEEDDISSINEIYSNAGPVPQEGDISNGNLFT